MKKLLLSLGALTAIVAPVASVVACGNTKELGIEKKDAIGDVEFYNFPAAQAQKFLDRIDHAKSTDEVSNILKEVDEAGKIWKAQGAKLDTPKRDAIGEIQGLTNLDKDVQDGYVAQINKATTQTEIDTALAAATKESLDKENHAKIEVDINTDINEAAQNKDFYLLRDYTKYTDSMKAATSDDELNAAYSSLKALINNPKIYKAEDGDFDIQLDNGKFLYFAKDATEATWTDMRDPKQPVTVFKKTGTDTSGFPILEIWQDGVDTNKQAVVDEVNAQTAGGAIDYGLVLEDMSGAYRINGVKDEADFIINPDVIEFMIRSYPVEHLKSCEIEDIEGMLTIVNDLLNKTGSSYTHVRMNSDNSKVVLN